jgi:hypothetical protein
MEFNIIDEAWMFSIAHGGQKGFEVRKGYTNKRKFDGKIRSYRYICAKYSHKKKDKRYHLTKCPRAETRTDCQVRMGVVCYATPIIQIFQDERFKIKIDPQLESTTQPKARGLLHMECDFATTLPYNLNFKTDELDHLPASRQFKYY